MARTSDRTGILIINLGTPDSPSTHHVRRYLREFLSDPRVIDIPGLLRFFLLNFIILPLRPARSAEAYRKIWTNEGSPLLIHTRDLSLALARHLPRVSVKFAMRYGSPSIPDVMKEFAKEGVRKIKVLPLYPQYAAASTASTSARVYECAASMNDPLEVEMLGPFFDHDGFLDATAHLARPFLASAKGAHVLFSYHGVPERQIDRSVRSGLSHADQDHCSFGDCCHSPGDRLALCYRAQCFSTTKGLVSRLQLKQEDYSIGFQSRLGRTPWVRPYTDELIQTLPARGVKHLAVICPSFVSDCLETLEEIQIRAKEDFLRAGGESFAYIPCLNSDETWVKAVAKMLEGE